MSLLFKHLRIHQIFGANTDVGKTILTTALIRASLANVDRVIYLKPVSSGPDDEADDGHVRKFTADATKRPHTECLFRLPDPVSPHLAAQRMVASYQIPSDDTFIRSVATSIKRAAETGVSAHMYVETAGGVHSPGLAGTTQLDLYRKLLLPSVLVGDYRLGGISSTISAYESLVLRGYEIDAVLLFKDTYHKNAEYLSPYFDDRGIRVFSVDPPPPKGIDPSENFNSTLQYYRDIVSSGDNDSITAAVSHLDSCHANRIEVLDSMPGRTLKSVWWPFVQHKLVRDEAQISVIDSAVSDFFSVYKPKDASTPSVKSLLQADFDGSASWWTQALGHGHPSLTLAAARASGRYGHVMFPQATHRPALELAERLLNGPGYGWASRVFFSDDGSTGMEVALKMALRSVSKRLNLSRSESKMLGVIGIKGSYHGDTIGAMDACEEGVYTCDWHNAKGYWFLPPTVGMQQGRVVITLPSCLVNDPSLDSELQFNSLSEVYDVEGRLDTKVAMVYSKYITRTLEQLKSTVGAKFGALVLEPIVMGAGGMIFVDPLFQRVMVDAIRGGKAPHEDWAGLPVIYDEVFVGLHRIGQASTAPLLGVNPDISVHAKILTGGIVPMAVTLASDAIFRTFLSDNKADALLHGHSYTAHPIGCEVANETLKIIDKLSSSESWAQAKLKWSATSKSGSSIVWSLWDADFVKELSCMDVVKEVMALGTVLVIKFKGGGGYTSTSAQALLEPLRLADQDPDVSPSPDGSPFGVNFRTLGDVAYFMTSLNTSAEVVRALEDKIWCSLQKSNV